MTTFEMFKRDVEELGLEIWSGRFHDAVMHGNLSVAILHDDDYSILKDMQQLEDWKQRRLKYYLDRLYAGSYEWSEAVVF